jgi:hypothetical protein
MAVLRIHKKQQNFVILDKTCLNDEFLSWGAKGLHAYLISLPDNWKVRVSDLKERATNGRDAVRGLLFELEQAGYIQKSTCRDDANGRFGGIEYLVLEVPLVKEPCLSPATEKPSSVKKEQTTPGPENPLPVSPETGNPSPANTTLININRINNKKLNNETAASTSIPAKATSTSIQSEAAAVSFSQAVRHELKSVAQPEQRSNPVELLSQEDGLVGSCLTQPQKQRINALVNSLNVSKKEILMEEIGFCLLNPKHFTACGNDFSRKLNAIRSVILRGDWQTPAGMMKDLSVTQNSNNLALKQLEVELMETHAEAVHFKKLLATAKENARAHFEAIITQAQSKTQHIEEKIKQVKSQQQEACY